MIVTLKLPVGVELDVVMVMVDVVVPLLVGNTVFGLKLHEAPTGRPEHVSETIVLNPFTEVIVIVDVPDCPTTREVGFGGDALTVKSGDKPVPDRETV